MLDENIRWNGSASFLNRAREREIGLRIRPRVVELGVFGGAGTDMSDGSSLERRVSKLGELDGFWPVDLHPPMTALPASTETTLRPHSHKTTSFLQDNHFCDLPSPSSPSRAHLSTYPIPHAHPSAIEVCSDPSTKVRSLL